MSRWLPAALLLAFLPAGASGQVVAEPVLSGRVLLGDSMLRSGTVVLHRLNDFAQGEVDSTVVAADGSFSLRMPEVPDPSTSDFYFASVRHDGVMYFGGPIDSAIQLDSLYEIQAYDTLLAPAEGVPIALEARTVFLEQTEGSWRVTDLFALRSDYTRTVVPRDGGRTWSYPLPAAARDVTAGEGEISADVAAFEDGALVVRAALPPGERLFGVSYLLDGIEITIPTPGQTETFDLLVNETAPPLEITGLEQTQSVELEAGVRFRRYAGIDITTPELRVLLAEEIQPPPVEWIAVILAIILAGGGLLALRGSSPASEVAAETGRQAVLVELAQLDEAFESAGRPTKNSRKKYERRRDELMRRLRPGE